MAEGGSWSASYTEWDDLRLVDADHWMVPPNVQGQGLCRTCRVTWPCDYAVTHAVRADEDETSPARKATP